MIAWNPAKIKAGVKTEHISAFWDVMPTLAELTGVAFASDRRWHLFPADFIL